MTQKDVDQKSEQGQSETLDGSQLPRAVASRGRCDLNNDTVKAPGFKEQLRPGGCYDS